MGISIPELASLLASSVGDDKATEAVNQSVRKLGLPTSRPLTRDQALEVLEHIASSSGIVGVTARFAKSRLHLRFSE